MNKHWKRLLASVLCIVLLVSSANGIVPLTLQSSAATSGTCGTRVNYKYDSASTLLVCGDVKGLMGGSAVTTTTASNPGIMNNYNVAPPPYIDYRGKVKSLYIGYHTVNIMTQQSGGYISYIGKSAFGLFTVLTSVTFAPNQVETIGQGAFTMCYALPSITIPNSVKQMGTSVFAGCHKLETVKLGTGLTSLAAYTFDECTSLKTITIPSNIKMIEEGAFSGCTALTTVSLPNTLNNIGASCFENCTALTGITLPNSIVTIEGACFDGCTALASITLPNKMKVIEPGVFSGCTALQTVTIPESVQWIESGAFSGCTALQTVRYLGSPAQWSEIVIRSGNSALLKANVQFVNSGTEANGLKWTMNTATGALTIQHNGAMADYTQKEHAPWYGWRNEIRSVTLSDGVTRIGDYAFAECGSLGQINVPAAVASIGSKAFLDCVALQSVQFDGNEIEMAYDAFARCGDYTICCAADSYWHTYAISNGLRYVVSDETASTVFDIKNNTLLGYSGTADKITTPSEITSVSYGAFRGNGTITRVALTPSVTTVGSSAFADCANLREVFIPDSVTSIGTNAFTGTNAAILCYENSYAHKYALANSIPVRLVHILIDLENAVMRVEIPYEDETEVSIVHLTGVSVSVVGVSALPARITYDMGEILNGSGLAIEAHYYNGMTSILHDGFTLSQPVFDTPGEKEVTVSYCGQTTTFNVNVTETVVSGDADGGGTLDIRDVITLSRYLAKGWNVQVDEPEADVNKDGGVDLKDVILLRRYLAGGWNVEMQ